MNETVAQGFFLKFDDRNDTAAIGAAVITHDEYLAVAGFVGVMPSVVGQKIVQAASEAGVKVTIVMCDGPEKIVALTWGELDPVKLWPMLALGIAESATKAFLNELQDVGISVEGMLPDDLNDDVS